MPSETDLRAELERIRTAARDRLMAAEDVIADAQHEYERSWLTFAAMSRAIELVPPTGARLELLAEGA